MKWKKMMLILSGSLFVVLCAAYLLFQTINDKKRTSDAYNIISLIQTGPEKEAVKSTYLAELMGLSIDQKVNLYTFDVKEAEKKLLASPIIKKVKVKKVFPNSIYIDYEVRKPCAWLYDYENVAIDEEGYIFPINPFFSPKEMCEIYANLPFFEEEKDDEGKEGGKWLKPLNCKQIRLALDILKHLSVIQGQYPIKLIRIDTSYSYFSSYGKREVVLLIEDEMTIDDVLCVFPRYIRLSSNNYQQQLGNYLSLREQMIKDYEKQIHLPKNAPLILRFQSKIIDMRNNKIAFIQQDD